jgi:methylenetetrahydrofolate reductase (NADPH)
MPLTSLKRLERVLELTQERRPEDFAAALAEADGADGRIQVGINWAANLARELVAGGAPGVHLYAFNEFERVTEVLKRANLV